MDTVRWKLNDYLEAHQISVYALIQASELSPNTVYEIARGKSKQARLETLGALLSGLQALTNSRVELTDVLEYTPSTLETEPEPPLPHLALAGMFDDPDSPGDVSARHDHYIGEGLESEHLETTTGNR